MGHCGHCHSYKVHAVPCDNCGRRICDHCKAKRDAVGGCAYRSGYFKPFGAEMRESLNVGEKWLF